jgi:hypothetical protein
MSSRELKRIQDLLAEHFAPAETHRIGVERRNLNGSLAGFASMHLLVSTPEALK